MIGPDPVEILDALGIAWGVHELYPNPTSQQAFLSAIQRLDPLRDVSLTYEIGAGSVACNGEELHIERGGTERLSRRLFVHEVQWLELTGVPSPVGLSQFFSLLAADEQETRAGGGIAQQLQSADVWSIAVTQRGLLTELVENAWEEREDKDTAPDSETGTEHVIRMLATGAPPGDVAGALVNTSDGNPDLMAESFIAAYRLVYSPADAEEANESVPEVLDAAYRSGPRGRGPAC